jgi:hypothetical protein
LKRADAKAVAGEAQTLRLVWSAARERERDARPHRTRRARVVRFRVEVTLRKRSRWTGEIVSWFEVCRSFEKALAAERHYRARWARRARVAIVPAYGVSARDLHALRTRAGMARAREREEEERRRK